MCVGSILEPRIVSRFSRSAVHKNNHPFSRPQNPHFWLLMYHPPRPEPQFALYSPDSCPQLNPPLSSFTSLCLLIPVSKDVRENRRRRAARFAPIWPSGSLSLVVWSLWGFFCLKTRASAVSCFLALSRFSLSSAIHRSLLWLFAGC